jgi:hypothetical protein
MENTGQLPSISLLNITNKCVECIYEGMLMKGDECNALKEEFIEIVNGFFVFGCWKF